MAIQMNEQLLINELSSELSFSIIEETLQKNTQWKKTPHLLICVFSINSNLFGLVNYWWIGYLYIYQMKPTSLTTITYSVAIFHGPAITTVHQPRLIIRIYIARCAVPIRKAT